MTDAEAETNALGTWCEELTHWKIPWCWERLKAGGEGANRGWDGWMASLSRWTWVWVNSRSWLWTGRPGVLQSMGSQRIGQDWATELSKTYFPGKQLFDSALWNSGRSRRLSEPYFLQTMKQGHRKGLYLWGPHRVIRTPQSHTHWNWVQKNRVKNRVFGQNHIFCCFNKQRIFPTIKPSITVATAKCNQREI